MSNRPDAELMALSARGETAAFAELVERYQNILLNFFMRRGVSWDDGQDLAQQTFLRLWNYRKKYIISSNNFFACIWRQRINTW